MNIRELFNKIFNKEPKMKDRTLFDYLSDSVKEGKSNFTLSAIMEGKKLNLSLRKYPAVQGDVAFEISIDKKDSIEAIKEDVVEPKECD